MHSLENGGNSRPMTDSVIHTRACSRRKVPIKKAAALYTRGEKVSEIAKAFGCRVQAVYGALARAGISVSPERHGNRKIDVEAAVALHDQGVPVAQIAKMCGCTRTAVYDTIRHVKGSGKQMAGFEGLSVPAGHRAVRVEIVEVDMLSERYVGVTKAIAVPKGWSDAKAAAEAVQRIANAPDRPDSWTDDDIIVRLHFRMGPPKTLRVETRIQIVATIVGGAK